MFSMQVLKSTSCQKTQRRVSKKFRIIQKSEEIVEVFVMFNSNEVLNQYITMKKINQKTVGLKSGNQDINLYSVEYDEEVKICPLCGKPYKG